MIVVIRSLLEWYPGHEKQVFSRDLPKPYLTNILVLKYHHLEQDLGINEPLYAESITVEKIEGLTEHWTTLVNSQNRV